MYAAVETIDIQLGGDRKVAVQMDDRPATEVERDWAISVVFAAARIGNPLRSGGCAAVRYLSIHEPSPRFAAFIAALGADLLLASDGFDPAAVVERPLPPPPTPETIAAAHRTVDEALRELGATLLAERGVTTVEDLARVEASFRDAATENGGRTDDKAAWWREVVRLGAMTAMLIDPEGRFVQDERFWSVIPYVFQSGESLANVFDRVTRYFEEGPSQRPSMLLVISGDEARDAGPVMFALRPRGWFGGAMGITIPLPGDIPAGLPDHDLPVLALVHDLPHSTRSIPLEEASDIAQLREEAMANLHRVEVDIEEVGPELLIAHGDYAAEKLLDKAFLLGIGQRFGAQMFCAAIPVRNELFLANVDMTNGAGFGHVVSDRYQRSPPNQQLSTEVFVIQDGEIVGVARAVGEARPPPQDVPRKGFFAKLFGW